MLRGASSIVTSEELGFTSNFFIYRPLTRPVGHAVACAEFGGVRRWHRAETGRLQAPLRAKLDQQRGRATGRQRWPGKTSGWREIGRHRGDRRLIGDELSLADIIYIRQQGADAVTCKGARTLLCVLARHLTRTAVLARQCAASFNCDSALRSAENNCEGQVIRRCSRHVARRNHHLQRDRQRRQRQKDVTPNSRNLAGTADHKHAVTLLHPTILAIRIVATNNRSGYAAGTYL